MLRQVADVELTDFLFQTLTAEQAEQIKRQIKYHLEAIPNENISLNDVISLRFVIESSDESLKG